MRQIIQATFLGLTKNPKFTPEFLNLLFLVTFIQMTVFAHYYKHSFRNNFTRETYEVQDQGLQTGQAQEAIVKETHLFSHVYLKTAANEIQAILQKVNGNPDPFFTKHVKSSDHFKELEDTNSQDPVFKFFFPFPKTSAFSLEKNQHEMPSKNPEPFNSTPFSAATFEAQKDQMEQSLENFLEDQEIKGFMPAPSTRYVEIEFKNSSSKEGLGEVSASKNESVINLPLPDVAEDASEKKSKPEFKAFYHYKIDSKNRLLSYWMQLTAPSKNVPEEEIPYRNALIKLLLSDKYQHLVTEANWLIYPEDDEETTLMLSKLREEAFYDYLRSINWEETEFGTLFRCPQITGKEDFHQANEDAFDYVYKLLGRCAPDFCRDEDFRVRRIDF